MAPAIRALAHLKILKPSPAVRWHALCKLVTEQGTEPEMTPPVKCVSGF